MKIKNIIFDIGNEVGFNSIKVKQDDIEDLKNILKKESLYNEI